MSIQFKPNPKIDEEDASIEELYDAYAETLRYHVKNSSVNLVEQYEELIRFLDVDLAKQGEP